MEFGLGGHWIWIWDSRILATSILQFLLLSFHPFDLNFSKFIRSSLNHDDEIIHLFRDEVSPHPQRRIVEWEYQEGIQVSRNTIVIIQ